MSHQGSGKLSDSADCSPKSRGSRNPGDEGVQPPRCADEEPIARKIKGLAQIPQFPSVI